MNKKSNILIFFVIILAVFSRLFITIPNFSAIGSIALFCGAIVFRNKFSILIPFIALFASDMMLALADKKSADYFTDGYFAYVYVAFGVTWLIGKALRNRVKISNVILASLISSVTFFLITNFGSWLQLTEYPKTTEGLGQAYLAGLAFYKTGLFSSFLGNQIIGDLFFNIVFFSSYLLLIDKLTSKLKPIRINS